MPDSGLIITWVAAIAATSIFLFWIADWWARRTPNDIDDVIVGVLQWPVVLILVTVAADNLLGHSTVKETLRAPLDRALNIVLVGLITFGVWRLVRDVILYYGRRLAVRSGSSFDEVLIPVLDVLSPVVIIGTGAVLMLRLMGADISTVVLSAGGMALIVGIALGDSLRNILGGLMLLVDTPFRFGDLVMWEGIVCQIKRIGLRVTTFYNTEDHSDIFLPNSALAAAKLVNITRPSPDLRMPIDISVASPGLVTAAKAMLHEVADANPYVLGDLPTKLEAMKRAQEHVDPQSTMGRELRWGLVALQRELWVDRYLASITRRLDRILETIRGAEVDGLTKEELATIEAKLAELDDYDTRLLAAMRRWARVRARDFHLQRYPEDRTRLIEENELRLEAYQKRLEHLRQHLKHPSLYEAQRLDDLVVEFRDWLPAGLKLTTPAWKYPLVSVLQAGPAGASLRLYVYVDDIHLEHFVRRLRVITDLREQATLKLQDLK